uniref:BZIP domain-containing protein n=1 Tax=Oryza meridionalis TaxID=40149 RepID=A0A0E0ENR0_9ORYZ
MERAAGTGSGGDDEELLLYRAEEQQQLGGGGGAERRKRRAMKNRESAERSRARKQAYLQELEQEVRLLRAKKRRPAPPVPPGT